MAGSAGEPSASIPADVEVASLQKPSLNDRRLADGRQSLCRDPFDLRAPGEIIKSAKSAVSLRDANPSLTPLFIQMFGCGAQMWRHVDHKAAN